MFRRKRFHKRIPRKPRTRVNHWIRISPIRLIDEKGKNIGVVETSQALKMAQERGLDLIEVAPNVRPPVCRIMDFGKFKYQQAQQEKKQKIKQTVVKIKGVRISVRTGQHDLETKAKQAGKFLEKGHKVKVEMKLRGREKALISTAREKLENFINFIPVAVKFEQDIKKQPNGLTVVISRDQQKPLKAEPNNENQKSASQENQNNQEQKNTKETS